MSEKKGFFGKLVAGLQKTRDNIISGMDSIFSGFSAIEDEFYEEIEETLIMGDLGIQTTMSIVEDLRKKVKEQGIKDPAECKELLMESIRDQMDLGENAYEFENRQIRGAGDRRQRCGKDHLRRQAGRAVKGSTGKKVILAAADTFRAAAIEQLTEWAHPGGCGDHRPAGGLRPGGCRSMTRWPRPNPRHADVLICDTAGRLHNKKNLMEELKEDQPDHREGVSRRHTGRRWWCWTARPGRTRLSQARAVYGSGGCHRYHPDEAGRNREGRNRRGDPVGTGYSGQIRGGR